MVGAGLGAGVGAVSHASKKDIKEQVADSLPPGSSGIVALFDEQWVAEVEKATANADNVVKHEVDKDSAEAAKRRGRRVADGSPAYGERVRRDPRSETSSATTVTR